MNGPIKTIPLNRHRTSILCSILSGCPFDFFSSSPHCAPQYTVKHLDHSVSQFSSFRLKLAWNILCRGTFHERIRNVGPIQILWKKSQGVETPGNGLEKISYTTRSVLRSFWRVRCWEVFQTADFSEQCLCQIDKSEIRSLLLHFPGSISWIHIPPDTQNRQF